MSLSNYTDLVKSITSWSHRNDVSTLIPDFIRLAEDEMYNNEESQLQADGIEATETLTASTSTAYLSLPSGFLTPRAMHIKYDDHSHEIFYQTPQNLKRRYTVKDIPFNYTVIAGQIEFDVIPDEEYSVKLDFYKRPDALTLDNQTNLVMTNHPNIYLYGALHQLFLWSEDDAESIKYFAKMQAAIRGVNLAAKKGKYGVSPVVSSNAVIP